MEFHIKLHMSDNTNNRWWRDIFHWDIDIVIVDRCPYEVIRDKKINLPFTNNLHHVVCRSKAPFKQNADKWVFDVTAIAMYDCIMYWIYMTKCYRLFYMWMDNNTACTDIWIYIRGCVMTTYYNKCLSILCKDKEW